MEEGKQDGMIRRSKVGGSEVKENEDWAETLDMAELIQDFDYGSFTGMHGAVY